MEFNIEDLRKRMTRKEFEKCLIENDIDGEVSFIFKNKEAICPKHIEGLKDQKEICKIQVLENGNCEKCWEKAIKDIKFRDEDKKEIIIKKIKTGIKIKEAAQENYIEILEEKVKRIEEMAEKEICYIKNENCELKNDLYKKEAELKRIKNTLKEIIKEEN